jgi:superfamily II DNA/RNA helicase
MLLRRSIKVDPKLLESENPVGAVSSSKTQQTISGSSGNSLKYPWTTPRSFKEFELDRTLSESIKAGGRFVHMTEIQEKSFDPIRLGSDVVVCSQTGTGKTLAYLVPLFDRIAKDKNSGNNTGVDLMGRKNPPVIVLCPSIDLCMQILTVAQSLDIHNRISKQFLGKRESFLSQEGDNNIIVGERIRWGAVDFVVSTPAKFSEDLGRFSGDNLYPSTVVFDEADFLFQGASKEHILEILNYLRPRPRRHTSSINPMSVYTQCVFVSATMPDIGTWTIGPMLLQRFMNATVVETRSFHSVPSSIDSIDFVPELEGNWEERCFLLARVLKENSEGRTLVFVNTQKNAIALHNWLSEKGWPSSLFKKNTPVAVDGSEIVIATDAGARGLDWDGGVDTVVNFQMPTDTVAWIHRIGRCGRLGRKGSVVSFYKKSDERLVELLKQSMGEKLDSLFSHKRSLRRKHVTLGSD